MKNALIAILFFIIIVLANVTDSLIEKSNNLILDKQSLVEQVSDYENILDDKLLKDYLRSISEKQSLSISNSTN